MGIAEKVQDKDLEGRRKRRRKREGKMFYHEIPNTVRYRSRSSDWPRSITDPKAQTRGGCASQGQREALGAGWSEENKSQDQSGRDWNRTESRWTEKSNPR